MPVSRLVVPVSANKGDAGVAPTNMGDAGIAPTNTGDTGVAPTNAGDTGVAPTRAGRPCYISLARDGLVQVEDHAADGGVGGELPRIEAGVARGFADG